MHRLLPHPATPPAEVSAVEVEAVLCRGPSTLVFDVVGGRLSLPHLAQPKRTDGLWQTTCFELFVRPEGQDGYFEFNFSPSTQWAAYRFDGYRQGMIELVLPAPSIEADDSSARVSIDLGVLPPGPWQVALTAVIEECDGTKSYWSLAHGADTPDFHHLAGFVLQV